MSDTTKIQWTNRTASPWYGCAHALYTDASGNEHAHQGCLSCYAEKMAKRNPGTLGKWGKSGTRIMSASFHDKCRKWNRRAEAAGVRATVFPSICDPFEDWNGRILDSRGQTIHHGKAWHSDDKYIGLDIKIGQSVVTMDDLRRDMFATIDACPWLDFLLLTKRPQNVPQMWVQPQNAHTRGDAQQQQRVRDLSKFGNYNQLDKAGFRPNVWLLTSISDQVTAEAMIHLLLKCRDLVPVLGVSAEPLLDDIDLNKLEAPASLQRTPNGGLCYDALKSNENRYFESDAHLDWCIVGCESNGKKVGRLPGDTEDGYWRAARRLIEQCREAEVACFHKQAPINGKVSGEPSDWPEWARVREMPEKASVTA